MEPGPGPGVGLKAGPEAEEADAQRRPSEGAFSIDSDTPSAAWASAERLDVPQLSASRAGSLAPPVDPQGGLSRKGSGGSGGSGGGSGSRRGSRAADLASAVLLELRRPSRRSSRAVAQALGEVEVLGGQALGEVGPASSPAPAPGELRTPPSPSGSARSSGGGSAASRDAVADGSALAPAEADDLGRGSRIPQYVAATVVGLAGFCNGVMFSWPSVGAPQLQAADTPLGGPPMSADEASWLAAAVCLAAGFATPAWVALSERRGRKATGLLVGLAFGAHWALLAAAAGPACVHAARAVGGLAAAGVFVVCPTYVKEISQDSIRGLLGTLFTILFNLGTLVVFAAGAVFSYKGMNILGFAFVLLFVVSFWQLPESPVYLLAKGENIQAAKALQWLRGSGADILDELATLKAAAAAQRQLAGSATLLDILRDEASARGLLLSTVLFANQPLSGLPVVLSSAVAIFQQAGGALSPHVAAVSVGALLLLGSAAASQLVERAGRRALLQLSNGAMAVCLSALGLYFFIRHLGISTESLHIDWLPVTSLCTFVVAASLGVGPLPFVVLTEIFQPEAQKLAATVGFCIVWFLSFATKFFVNISAALGLYTCYWLFAAFCVLSLLYVKFCMPETKGRSLESILQELEGSRGEEKPPGAVKLKEIFVK